MTVARNRRTIVVALTATLLVAAFAHGVAAQPGPLTAVVSFTDGDGLNLREAPSLSAAVLTVMPEGAVVEVHASEIYDDTGRAWTQLSYNGLSGYGASQYLRNQPGIAVPVADVPAPIVPVAPEQPQSDRIAHLWWLASQAVVSGTDGDGVNVRSEPSLGGVIIAGLPEGAELVIIGGARYDAVGNTWYEISSDGISGYVYGAYVARTSSAIGAAIAAEAMGYLGTPYIWAGTTPAGFDCSGFTYFIVNRVLANDFPRAIYAQVERGETVSLDTLEVGDLVFHQNTYEVGLSHVGIYIGNGEFISAVNEADGVAIRNLWDEFWIERYLTARRVR